MISMMFAPKGQHADILTEATFPISSLLSLYNDSIITGRTKRAGEIFHTEETVKATIIKFMRIALTFFGHCEAFLEVAILKFKGDELKWKYIYFVEWLKASIRAYLLFNFPNEMICSGGMYESHLVVAPLPAPPPAQENNAAEHAHSHGGNANPPATASPPAASSKLVWKGTRTGRSLPIPVELEKYSQRGLVQLQVDPNSGGSGEANPIQIAGEVLHIARPLVYLYLLRRVAAAGGDYSYKLYSFVVCLLMDVGGIQLSRYAQQQRESAQAGGAGASAKHNQEEIGRRTKLLFFYLLRSPMYEAYLQSWFKGLVESTKDIAGVSFIPALIYEQLQHYHKTHFYIAAS